MKMLLIDVHCHLDHDKFKQDLPQVIERAKKAGLKAIVAAGVNSQSNRFVLELAKKYDVVKASPGLYPIDALGKENVLGIEGAADESGLPRQIKPIDVDAELEWIAKNKNSIISVGEVGLDYKFVKDEKLREKMRENFRKIIAAVEKLKKPIIVHSRDAEQDVIEILEKSKLKKVVLHCFSGRKSLIKRAADNGWSFSVPAVITRLQHFQTLVGMVNINQLLTETDAPWLSPVAGTRNEPANVVETIKKIAEIKGFNVEETADSIFMNYKRMFE